MPRLPTMRTTHIGQDANIVVSESHPEKNGRTLLRR